MTPLVGANLQILFYLPCRLAADFHQMLHSIVVTVKTLHWDWRVGRRQAAVALQFQRTLKQSPRFADSN